MKMISVPALGRSASVLGFGCASLGSRIGEKDALTALGRALDSGVTWYDVAPSYGDGNAERILGAFLRGRREKVIVATKVGIAPSKAISLANFVKPIVRVGLSIAPSLRAIVAKSRPQAKKLALSPELIVESVENSLRAIGSDYIDVLALHEPIGSEADRPEILETLRAIVSKGQVRAVSVAGSLEANLAFMDASHIFRLMQIANDPFSRTVEKIPRAVRDRITIITHGVFGISGPHARLTKKLEMDKTLRASFHEGGFSGGPAEVAGTYLIAYARACNPEGICLLSMNRKHHLVTALSSLDHDNNPSTLDLANRLDGC